MKGVDPETLSIKQEGRQGRLGGWDLINQGFCMHIHIAHRYRQWGGGLSAGVVMGMEEGRWGRLERVNMGGKEPYIILSAMKNYKRKIL